MIDFIPLALIRYLCHLERLGLMVTLNGKYDIARQFNCTLAEVEAALVHLRARDTYSKRN